MQGGVGIRRLGVVVVLHPPSFAYQRDAVGEGTECRQGISHTGTRRAGREGRAGGGQRVGEVVGHRARERRDIDEIAAFGIAQTAVDDARRAFSRRIEAHRDEARARARGERRRDRVVGVVHEHVAGTLRTEDPCLGFGVRVERAVPIEMVVGYREEHRDPGVELHRERELERRHLGDDDVDTRLRTAARVVDQRRPDVARRDGAPARRLEHRRDQRRHRRLPVGSGDRDDRCGDALRRELDLTDDGHEERSRGRQRRMIGSDAGARYHQREFGDERVPAAARRAFEHGDAGRARDIGPRRVVGSGRMLLDDGDLDAFAPEHGGRLLPRLRQPEHEHATGTHAAPTSGMPPPPACAWLLIRAPRAAGGSRRRRSRDPSRRTIRRRARTARSR